MSRHLVNRLKFLLERLVLRGAQYRLLIIAALIGAISLLAGVIIHLLDAGVEGGLPGAVWWAFLRLSDPGYLGDDEGTVRRIVSTILTVLGYVVFLGALIAIMTQWLNERMRALEAGLTPLAQRGHVLIIGWNSRTPAIVRELMMAEARVQRFLQARGTRSLRIAILAEEVTTRLGVELRERLGRWWHERQVIFRSGSPLRVEHLQRVDFIHAGVVIMPAADLGGVGPEHADTRTIKTLLSMANHPHAPGAAGLPPAVAEIFDSRHADVARRAYRGRVEVLASDAIIGRLLAQNIRHAGLSDVYGELLTHDRGNEIYVRGCGDLAGLPFREAGPRFDQAILLGLLRPHGDDFVPLLNPAPGTTVREHDRLVLLARSYAATAPGDPAGPPLPLPSAAPLPLPRLPRPRRVLLLGWNHKAPALLRELESYDGEAFDVTIMSTIPATRRQQLLQRHDVRPLRTTLHHVEADFATPAALDQVDVAAQDNVVLLGSDRFDSGEESDARSIVGYLLLRDRIADGGPAVLVELLDAGNIVLFRDAPGEFLISPVILSHMLAQVALRRELRAVFDELFGPGGAEIGFRRPDTLGLGLGDDVSFGDVAAAAAAHGEVALGIRTGGAGRGGAVTLNPPAAQRWGLAAGDAVIVLATVSVAASPGAEAAGAATPA